jgi:C1A family cysteine protease
VSGAGGEDSSFFPSILARPSTTIPLTFLSALSLSALKKKHHSPFQQSPSYCGSCWAHASLSMLGDRLKIAKKGEGPDVMLSRQTLLNCAAFKGFGAGCDGGDPIDVFRYMAKEGLPDESCLSYTATDHSKYAAIGLKHCPAGGYCVNCMPVNDKDTCWPVKTPILYYVTSYGRVGSPDADPADNARAMQAELVARGPIVCSIATPDAFVYKYDGGIFDDHNKSTIDDVDHDVSIVGYGEDEGTGRPYWLVRNSWGSYWGTRGFFKIPRGENALWVEAGDCWAATIEHGQEDDVQAGKLVGSMYGLVKRKGGGGGGGGNGGGRRAGGVGLARPGAV